MSRLKSRIFALVPALALALFAGACDTSETTGVDPDVPTAGDEVTTLKILLTDAPANYVSAAEVDIGRVEILPADDGPAITLTEDGTDGFVDLLDFQNSATMQLAEADIPSGAYHQLRLFVEGARAQINDVEEWIDLKVPSGAQTGIKLLLRDMDGEHLELVPGEKVIVLDFDVNRSFVVRGNPNAPGFKGVIFKPTLKVTGEDVAASISGMLSVEEGLPADLVAGQTVIAEPTGGVSDPDITEYGYQTDAGTAVTGEDGSYTIFFLVPGEYEVSVMDLEAGLGTEPQSEILTLGWSENATGVDFQIVDVTGSISGAVTLAETITEEVPVDGLDVSITPVVEGEDPEPVAVVPTDETGAYSVDGLMPGIYTVSVAFDSEGYVLDPAEIEVEVGRDEDVTGVDFTVYEVNSVRGAVSTELEGFELGALVVTASTDAEGVDDVEAETDAEGNYVFLDLADATWTITVTVGEGFVTVPESLEVVLDGTSAFTGQDFVVEEEPAPTT